ncbi:MAG TPA: peptidylprolyl isomerase [Ktedonobacteraceae bacterium]
MNTQTERSAHKPSNQRNKTGKSAKRYYKQTAHVEARRDGKPLIFGWGKHLSHTEKVRVQRRATWGLAALIVLLLASVIVSSWINFNIIVPGQAITTVNGHSIPQSVYRQMVGVKTQLELNKLYGPSGLTTQLTDLERQYAQANSDATKTTDSINALNDQIKKLKPTDTAKKTNLQKQVTDLTKTQTAQQKKAQDLGTKIQNLNQNTIPAEKQGFTQDQIGNDSATWLQDDELIREWLTTQNSAFQAKINPTAHQVNSDFNSLKANMPKSNGYNTFLSQMGISDDQIRAMLTILARRNNAQTYFASLLTSPSYQVLARQIVLPTQQKANQVLQELQKGQDFGKLAKQNSQDTNTNQKGGSIGWLTYNQYIDASGFNGNASAVENWLFDRNLHLNELSPVISTYSAYYIVQIMNIDPSRDVDATLLKALKNNALINWLKDRRALHGQNITSVDQTMLIDSNNLPPNNILPVSAPAQATPQA